MYLDLVSIYSENNRLSLKAASRFIEKHFKFGSDQSRLKLAKKLNDKIKANPTVPIGTVVTVTSKRGTCLIFVCDGKEAYEINGKTVFNACFLDSGCAAIEYQQDLKELNVEFELI